jgi:hypothetical protein
MPEYTDNGNGEFRGSTKARLQILAEGQAAISQKIESLHKEALTMIEVQRERITNLETWRATLTARITLVVGVVCTIGTFIVNWVTSQLSGG